MTAMRKTFFCLFLLTPLSSGPAAGPPRQDVRNSLHHLSRRRCQWHGPGARHPPLRDFAFRRGTLRLGAQRPPRQGHAQIRFQRLRDEGADRSSARSGLRRSRRRGGTGARRPRRRTLPAAPRDTETSGWPHAGRHADQFDPVQRHPVDRRRQIPPAGAQRRNLRGAPDRAETRLAQLRWRLHRQPLQFARPDQYRQCEAPGARLDFSGSRRAAAGGHAGGGGRRHVHHRRRTRLMRSTPPRAARSGRSARRARPACSARRAAAPTAASRSPETASS